MRWSCGFNRLWATFPSPVEEEVGSVIDRTNNLRVDVGKYRTLKLLYTYSTVNTAVRQKSKLFSRKTIGKFFCLAAISTTANVVSYRMDAMSDVYPHKNVTSPLSLLNEPNPFQNSD